MKHIYAIGELLVDFVCSDVDKHLSEGVHFIKKPGGAPANVCAVVGQLGGNTTFMGAVGNDAFGTFLLKTLNEKNVDTSYCMVDDKASTTLAFVSLLSNGERDFVFCRGADANLDESGINCDMYNDRDIIHFGSATGFLGGNLENFYIKAIRQAFGAGMFVSFDPNYRNDLWKNNEEVFISKVKNVLPSVRFAKFSEDEICLISGKKDVKEAVFEIHKYGVDLVAVTLGEEGSIISNKHYYRKIPSISIKCIDSTGAGDAFVGALLLELSLSDDCFDFAKNEEKIIEAVQYANVVASLVCTKYGALSSIPNKEEINSALKSNNMETLQR